MTEHLHQYRDTLFRIRRSPSLIVQGPRERFISLSELSRSFGGYILSRAPESEEEVLGVWGARKASRFRRLLRECGACFEIEHHDTPPFNPKLIAHPRRRKDHTSRLTRR